MFLPKCLFFLPWEHILLFLVLKDTMKSLRTTVFSKMLLGLMGPVSPPAHQTKSWLWFSLISRSTCSPGSCFVHCCHILCESFSLRTGGATALLLQEHSRGNFDVLWSAVSSEKVRWSLEKTKCFRQWPSGKVRSQKAKSLCHYKDEE